MGITLLALRLSGKCKWEVKRGEVKSILITSTTVVPISGVTIVTVNMKHLPEAIVTYPIAFFPKIPEK